MKPDWNELREAVRLIGCATHAAYMCTLRGDIPAGSSDNFKPQVGRLVMECSSFYYAFQQHGFERGYDPLNCIGTLERIASEPLKTPEEWNEGIEDKSEWEVPPDESVHYLRTLDGREYRWTNCMFILVPDTPNFKAINPKQ